MSFPSAIKRLEEQNVTPETASTEQAEAALMHAMQNDTDLGFVALAVVVEAMRERVEEPVAFIRERLPEAVQEHVLRFEWRGETGLKVDFDPNSEIGGQIARLMGTDVARGLFERKLEVHSSFANCCAPIVAANPDDVAFTPADQIRWQHSIDC
jgi:hypothetical protein